LGEGASHFLYNFKTALAEPIGVWFIGEVFGDELLGGDSGNFDGPINDGFDNFLNGVFHCFCDDDPEVNLEWQVPPLELLINFNQSFQFIEGDPAMDVGDAIEIEEVGGVFEDDLDVAGSEKCFDFCLGRKILILFKFQLDLVEGAKNTMEPCAT
jgi:hypothetical protein